MSSDQLVVLILCSVQDYDCGFARLDGSWYSDPDCATKVSLCAVCELVGQPVLHLRGMCDQSALDWAFYPQPSNASRAGQEQISSTERDHLKGKENLADSVHIILIIQKD